MEHYRTFDEYLSGVTGVTETIELTDYKPVEKKPTKKKTRKEAADDVQAD